MKCVFLTESAILVHFKSVRIILLVLHGIVVSLLTFRACQGNFYSHFFHPFLINKTPYASFLISISFSTQIKPLFRGRYMLSHFFKFVNGFLTKICGIFLFFPEYTTYCVVVFVNSQSRRCAVKKVFSIMSVYIGLIIGAGFASGREIFEFFNLSSRSDFMGIILAAIFFGIIAYITMQQANRFGVLDYDSFIEKTSGGASPIIKALMVLYMFCGFFVMMSGSGVLIGKTFSAPSFYGVFLLALICFVVFSFDLKGLVAINSVMVPIMVVGITFLCLSSALVGSVPTFMLANDLRRNPIISAVCYVGYNTITAGAVLVPIAAHASPKQCARAAVISSTILGLLIFTVWSALNVYYDAIFDSEMPLLDIASTHGKLYDIIYTLVLFMALCTTAVSHGFGIMAKFKTKNTRDRILISAVLCLAAMPFAKIGFSDLITNLYSAFGMVGIVWMVWLLISYVKQNK